MRFTYIQKLNHDKKHDLMGDLSKGVKGFDEDRLKVSLASVVSGREVYPVLPIQRAGDMTL